MNTTATTNRGPAQRGTRGVCAGPNWCDAPTYRRDARQGFTGDRSKVRSNYLVGWSAPGVQERGLLRWLPQWQACPGLVLASRPRVSRSDAGPQKGRGPRAGRCGVYQVAALGVRAADELANGDH